MTTPRISALLLLLALTGCASLDRDQCLHADWHQIGYADGTNGLSGARIDDHAKACAEYGVHPKLDEYLAGRKQGLINYCQAENGFELGRRGSEHNVADCAENLKPAFLQQYHHGSQIHVIESDIASHQARISNNHRQIHRNDERIAEIRAELRASDLSADRRAALLGEFNRLVEQKDMIGRDNLWLQSDVARLQANLYLMLREFGR